MAPLKSVAKLCDFCLKIVKSHLLESLLPIREKARIENDPDFKVLQDYFSENVPQSVCADILDAIMQDGKIDTEIKCFAFFILQGPNSRRLKFSLGFPFDYHSRILSHLENSSADLEVADFRGLWLQGPNVDLFCRTVVCQMSHLRQLSLPHIATDSMIDFVVDSCRQLISLDLYGCTGVTSRGVRTLSRKLGSKLQFLNLGGPVESPIKPEMLSECLPDFKEVSSFGSYPFGGAAVANLAGKNLKNISLKSRTKLKYLHDRYTTADTLAVLSEVCPNLQSIFLDTPDKGILKLLPKLDKLSKLKVSKVDCEDLHTALDLLKPDDFKRLTTLEIINARGSLDLYKISKSFPKLEVFEIYYSTSVHVSINENFQFRNLKKLVVYDTDLAGSAPETILSGCPNIVTITLAHCEEITDEKFAQILEKNQFSQCRDFSLLFAPQLTSDTVRLIISCLDNVRYIGRLDNWNVAWTEVEELRFEILHFNLEVTLGEQFNNIDKFEAVEHQENQMFGLLDLAEEGQAEGEEQFFDVLFVPDDVDEFFFE